MNLFAVLIIFLLIIPFGETDVDAEAPTENREETAFVDTRACYVESLRPSSIFVVFNNATFQIIDFDELALAFLEQEKMEVVTNQGEMEVELLDQNDGNTFRLVFEPAAPIGRDADQARADDDVAVDIVASLEREVFELGYAAVIFVPFDEVAAFASVHRLLVENGERFRWRVVAPGETITRARMASIFRSGDFCR